ncbi:hypothetical protein [Flavobacterium sp. ov086]|uniref:hypothetical protein n=1 Tax=Flavobacterium sp. ov086 TaxID=1761785 RepID=UPI000B632667|nr:hypothetical protein [Flavobacterium sp. ov086]SNR71917.1 hypothetical protein SAMN04487979_11828 [Flavobacterium sp. ov086]
MLESISEKLAHILKSDYANPFLKDFDLNKIIDNYGEEFTEKELSVISFVNECNQISNEIQNFIFNSFLELNFTKKELLDFLFKSINKNHFEIIPLMTQQLMGEKIAFHQGDIEFSKFISEDGSEVSMQHMIEVGGDILGYLISLLNKWNPIKTDYHPRISFTDLELGQFFYLIWNHANIFLNIESAYAILIYENGDLEESENSEVLKILSGIKWIKLLNQASEIRTHSNFYELRLPLSYIYKKFNKKKIGVTNCEISSDYINLVTGTIDETDVNLSITIHLLSKYYHYQNQKLEYYNGLTLEQLNKALIPMVELTYILFNNKTLSSKETSVNQSPAKIKKDHLISYLKTCTDFDEILIIKILKALTSSSDRPYLWRRPLFEVNNDIYFCISTLSAPNYTLLYEQILIEANHDNKKRALILKNYIEEELTALRIKFNFKKTEINHLDSLINLDNNLFFELQDYYILIETKCFDFPIESKEIHNAIIEISESTFSLVEKIEVLSNYFSEKKIVPVIISNYNKFSNLSINGISIIDYSLFTNYIETGSLKRGLFSYENNQPIQKEYAEITYYKDENEFNNNFINFLSFAPPISVIRERMIWRETDLTPEGFIPKIITEAIDKIDEGDHIANRLVILENALNNKYYYDLDKRTKELYDESIEYSISNILNQIAYADYDISVYKSDLLEIIKKCKIEGFTRMVNSLNNAFSNISYLNIIEDKTFDLVECEPNEFFELLTKIFQSQPSNMFRLYDFTVPDKVLTKEEEKKIISVALNILYTLKPEKITDERIEDFMLQITIIKAFKNKYSLDYEFFTVCHNFVDTLNYNSKYQRARNFSEEILVISIQEKKHYYGWGLLFNCFIYQNSPFEASIYGSLYYTSLSRYKTFKYSVQNDLLHNALKFYRTFNFFPMMENLNIRIDELKLKVYDRQKFKLSYYLGIIKIGSKKPEIINESLKYLDENINDIISFEENGIIPWLNYLYNVKRYEEHFHVDSYGQLANLISKLEAKIGSNTILTIRAQHFGDEKNNKKNLINLLVSVFETNSSHDFKFEVKHLELNTKNLLSQALKEEDIDGILLCGIIINDNNLTFNNKYHAFNTVVKSIPVPDKEIIDRLNNYLTHIKKEAIIAKNNLLVWLFNLNSNIYVLTINSEKNISLKELKKWDIQKMRLWSKSKKDFYFNSNNYFDLGAQDDAYVNSLETFAFTDLEINLNYEEVFFCSSIDLSEFSSNLIINNGDFLSSKVPFTNIISLEWFIKNSNEYLIKDKFTSTAWIPIEDEDIPINISFKNIKPVLEKQKTNILTSRHIKKKIDTDINIFLAHGELGFMEFKGIYTNHDSKSAIVDPKYLFGHGEIAILFICNSGVVTEDFFAKGVSSLCHDILALGYKAVIAPFWRLDITIPSYWLESFLDSFNEGYKISEAVHIANLNLGDYKENISTAFIVPEGKLAMHIYGNPNIRIAK